MAMNSPVASNILSDGDIIMLGESLRLKLHCKDNGIIQNRRYHLRTYTKCVVGMELLDWLIVHEEVKNRRNGVRAMQKLIEKNILHHVCDDHGFKDEMLFYRFRVDDETFYTSAEATILLEGERLRYLLHSEHSTLFHDYTAYKTQKASKSFLGSDLVTWLVQHGRASLRQEAETYCRKLLENGVIRHVTDDHHFKDQKLFYQFRLDMLNVKLDDIANNEDGQPPPSPSASSDHSNDSTFFDRSIRQMSNDESMGKRASLTGSALKKPVTLQELRDPNAPYVKKNIKIVRDNVGFGFVVRGKSPVFVQTVDPSGPGYAAGLKPGQLILSVNGQCVLECSHSEVADLIVNYPSTIDLIIMTPISEEE